MFKNILVISFLLFSSVIFAQREQPFVLDLSFEHISLLDTSNVKSTEVTALILDGNPIDLLKNKAFLSSLKRLKFLSLRNCDIDVLPVEIKELTNLKVLDLSGNRLRFLPYSIKELDGLQELNLSNNKLDSLGFQIGRLTALRDLDVSGNSNVDLSNQNFEDVKLDVFSGLGIVNLPESLQKNSTITKLIIGQNLESDLGNVLSDSSSVQDVYVYSSERQGFVALINDLKKSNVKSLSIGSKKLKSLPAGISKLYSLQELTILESPIRQLPNSFNQLQQLRRLTINASKLKSLSSSIQRLKGLKYLNIENTAIDEVELKKIIKGLPNCEIVFNSKLMGEPAIVEREDIPKEIDINNIEFTKVSKRIDPKKGSVINLSKGAVLNVPANAFIDSKGNVIEDSVLLNVKELNDPLSLAMEKIPLEVDGENGLNRLSPTKTYVISGETKGKDSVFINPNNKPNLAVPNNSGGDVYVFKVKKNKWNAQDSLTKRLENLETLSNIRKAEDYVYDPFTDHIQYDKVYLQMKNKKRYGGTCIKLTGYSGSTLKKKFSSGGSSKVSFHQINALTGLDWLIVSANPEVERREVGSILNVKEKTTTSSLKAYLIKDLEDFIVEYDTLKDVMVFRFVTKQKVVSIDVIPTSDLYDQINGAQREVARVFKKYKRSRGQIIEKNENVHKLFKDKYDKYLESYRLVNDSLRGGEENFDQYQENSYLYKSIAKKFKQTNEIGVSEFGIYGIGNMESEIDRVTFQEAKIIPVDSAGNKLAVLNLIVLAKWGNTYRYGMPSHFEYPILKKVALLGLLANGDYAVLNSSLFWNKRILSPSNDFGEVEFEVVKAGVVDINKMRKKLKI